MPRCLILVRSCVCGRLGPGVSSCPGWDKARDPNNEYCSWRVTDTLDPPPGSKLEKINEEP